MAISLIIPAFNEEDRLPTTLERYVPALERLEMPFEIVVIADGSDGTPGVAERYSGRGVRCYSYHRKLGRGGAIFEGFRRSRFDVIAYVDADGSIEPDDGLRVIRRVLEGAPAAIASRRLVPSLVNIPEPRARRFIGSVWHFLVRALLKLDVKDAQCGFKAFHRLVVDNVILPRVTITNRTFEVDMLLHVQQAGLEIAELPVAYVHDERTRMPITKAVPVMFATLLGIFLYNVVLRHRRRPPEFLVKLNARLGSV